MSEKAAVIMQSRCMIETSGLYLNILDATRGLNVMELLKDSSTQEVDWFLRTQNPSFEQWG